MSGPRAAYRALVAQGALHPDPAQAMAVEKLESLAIALAACQPTQGASGWAARFGFGRRSPRLLAWTAGDCETTVPKQGLYLYGDVGRGKSALMDMFFATAAVEAKQRLHFHEFMQGVHADLFAWRRDADRRENDPIPHVARTIARRAWLLCLDDLHVGDIGDAMILGRLFEELFALGVVLVITSNRPPDDLYKDGLKRDRFLPFIALIKLRLDLLQLDSEGDYRLGRKKGMRVYHTPPNDGAEQALAECFGRLTGGKTPTADRVHVLGRSWPVPRSADGVAWFTFDELCRSNLGPADYLTLATLYHTVVVSRVPTLSPDGRDAAKRFITLVDALYEHRVTLICSAEAPPESLYPTGEGAFEFRRTVSRLMEMQSEDYLARPHLT
jgi:cell division protein ZapE